MPSVTDSISCAVLRELNGHRVQTEFGIVTV
jgi:hypothetical protein